MEIRKYNIYSADLNPGMGTEPGKTRPVEVVQTDLLNNPHPSTIICPVTGDVNRDARILRVHLNSKANNLTKPSDILVDQIRAIDNRRFKSIIGKLTESQILHLNSNLKIIVFE
jgi:mRNA interferase MazF